MVAGTEGGGLGPSACGLVPEEVVAGGVDDRGPPSALDCQVVAVCVVVDHHCGDRFGLGLTGLRIGGQDLVAGCEAGDGHGYPAGQQDLGAGGERRPARGDAGISGILPGVGGGVFCCFFCGFFCGKPILD